MLAKQGWRILTRPNSLIARLYKARYFPTGSFMSAALGDTPSFSWRSITAGRAVLQSGIKWQVDSGTSISIWDENWIPDCPRYMVQKPPQCMLNRVSELIDHPSRTWNPQLVRGLFLPTVADKILCIPLSGRIRSDRLCWSPDKKGIFSVKTAYWTARVAVMGNSLASTSNGDPCRELWRRLWKSNVPHRVQNTIWRACSSILPTKDRLETKGLQGDLACPLCPHRYESIMHTLCECTTARKILLGSPFNLGDTLQQHAVFKWWMYDVALALPQDIFEQLLVVLDAIWKNRNDALWENKIRTAEDLVFGAISWLLEFQQVRKSPTSHTLKPKATWKPPMQGFVKVNVDGSFLPQKTSGGTGGVIRDASGDFIAAFAKPVPNIASAKHVELSAIKAGLLFLQSLGQTMVIVESDCLEAVQAVNSTHYEGMAEAGLIDDIKFLLHAFTSISVKHIPRNANSVAHRLAAIAYEDKCSGTWYHSPPNTILDVLMSD